MWSIIDLAKRHVLVVYVVSDLSSSEAELQSQPHSAHSALRVQCDVCCEVSRSVLIPVQLVSLYACSLQEETPGCIARSHQVFW